MLKMMIRMDDRKITTEKIPPGQYLQTINNTFLTMGLTRVEDESSTLGYRNCGRAKDLDLFGKIINALKSRHGLWMM